MRQVCHLWLLKLLPKGYLHMQTNKRCVGADTASYHVRYGANSVPVGNGWDMSVICRRSKGLNVTGKLIFLAECYLKLFHQNTPPLP